MKYFDKPKIGGTKMKYYTYQEHHVFCVESGIDSCLLWKQVADLGWLPEGIYHNPANAFNPKKKEKQKKYKKKYRSTPEYKAWQKKYKKKYRSTPEYKAWRKEYYRRNKK